MNEAERAIFESTKRLRDEIAKHIRQVGENRGRYYSEPESLLDGLLTTERATLERLNAFIEAHEERAQGFRRVPILREAL